MAHSALQQTLTETRDQSAPITGIFKFLRDVKYLWLEQISEVAVTWYWYLFMSILVPVGIIFGFSHIGTGLNDRNSLIFIISGSAIFSVASDSLCAMAQRIGIMKKEGTLTYYASLPISKVAFVVAIMLSRLVVTLPGMLGPIITGAWLNHIQLDFSPWILVLLPLTGLTLAAVGIMVGSLIENLDIVNAVVSIMLFLLVMVGPVFVPMSVLPLPVQWISYIFPPTYAADALRHTLNGVYDSAFYIDIAVLAVMTVISLYAMTRWMRWGMKVKVTKRELPTNIAKQ